MTQAILMKICSKCGKEKPLSDFNKHSEGKYGVRPDCKDCQHAYKKQYRAANIEKLKAINKKYRIENRDKIREKQRQWEKKNPDKVAASGRRFRLSHPEYEKERHHKYASEHPEQRRANARKRYKIDPAPKIASMLKWRENNPEKYREAYLKTQRKNRITPQGKLNNMMGRSIWTAIKGNKRGMKWEDLVGYTVDQLKKHIEKQFLPGMTWKNYSHKTWHIDHIIPKCVFNYQNPEDIDFKRCWALKNLRPMWASENMKKGNNLHKPFQPALAI